MARTKTKPAFLATPKLKSIRKSSTMKNTPAPSIERPKRTIRVRTYDGLTDPKLFQFLHPPKTVSPSPIQTTLQNQPVTLNRPRQFCARTLVTPSRSLSVHRFPKKWELDDFINLKEIGSGGFGKVFQAFAKPLQVDVALKFINWEAAEVKEILPSDVQSEYELHRKISHENICRILGEFKLNADHVFVLDFCTKGDLHDYIYDIEGEIANRSFPRTLTRSMGYLKQIINATLHIQLKMGYIHMDVKPENVLITSSDVVKVTDFGHAVKLKSYRFIHKPAEARGGTFYYQPPELLNRFGFDSTADVWAIGCIAYELLLQKHPFFLDVSHEQYRSPQQNFHRALGTMKLMQDKKFPFSRWTKLSQDHITFLRQILGRTRAERPLIRELENLGLMNSYCRGYDQKSPTPVK